LDFGEAEHSEGDVLTDFRGKKRTLKRGGEIPLEVLAGQTLTQTMQKWRSRGGREERRYSLMLLARTEKRKE